MAPESTFFRVRDLQMSLNPPFFGDKPRQILNGVSFNLEPGKSLTILGQTSSGKTLLLRSLTRFYHGLPLWDVSGEVYFEGKNLLKTSQTRLFTIRGARIAHVLQDAHRLFNPQLTVQQHFNLLLRLKKRKIGDRLSHAMSYLYKVGIVDPEAILLHRVFPDELDVATRQRIMIASALACEPRILVADEPTAEFDSGAVGRLVDLLEALKKERGLAVVLATGRVRRAEQFGDEIAVLHDGRLTRPASPRELFAATDEPATRAFAEGTLLAGANRERLVSQYFR